MPRCAAAPLQRRADDRIADIARDIEDRAEGLGLFGREPFVVDPRQAIGVHVTFSHLNVMRIVRQHHDAARRIHDIVVELLRQSLPQLQGVLIERGRFLPEVIGADDCGVPPRVAAAEPALLQHRDIAEAVFLGKIVGGREPMAACADDDRIIGRLRLRSAPLLRPAGVVLKRLQRHIDKGKSHLMRLRWFPRDDCPLLPRLREQFPRGGETLLLGRRASGAVGGVVGRARDGDIDRFVLIAFKISSSAPRNCNRASSAFRANSPSALPHAATRVEGRREDRIDPTAIVHRWDCPAVVAEPALHEGAARYERALRDGRASPLATSGIAGESSEVSASGGRRKGFRLGKEPLGQG